ncbi:MAG: chloride channel protein [Negativicutes bacterium]|nr:chloride channel protein [Negativicutes bacterium]
MSITQKSLPDVATDWPFVKLRTLRALVRADEIWLAILVAGIGALAGLGVVFVNTIASLMHQRLFLLQAGQGISDSAALTPSRAFGVPVLGGVALGLFGSAISRLKLRKMIDPVEANALYGGRMSLSDSLIITVQTTWSNGVGASVGMEAGYAQFGAGIASRIGRMFQLRRSDLRLLVGCGAAAAIGGAFNAPLCGAFYGIELIMGVYSIVTLPFVVIAALAGTLTVQMLLGPTAPLNVTLPATVPASVYPAVLALGVACGLLGIVIMRGVTLIEAGFRHSHIPAWARPAFGGVVVGAIGCITPSAMSSGHSALHADINATFPWMVALALLLLKATASAFSIGAGFRGGLFFASLFMGVLFGKVFAGIVGFLPFIPPMPNGFYAVVGMSALAVAIVGGPMTMTFLALESTANFSVTMAVLAASIVAAITVRRLFGYSFSTWRFHLKGKAIRSAADIGWLQMLTVGRMMRKYQQSVDRAMSLVDFRREFPLGAAQRVIVTGPNGSYAGMAYPAEACALDNATGTVEDILHQQVKFLLPDMTVKEALSTFEAAEADAVVVLDGPETRQILGLLTEQYALRRYSEELDRRRREHFGE